MRLNFWIALLVCLAALVWFAAIQRRGRARGEDRIAAPADASPARPRA